MRPLRNFAILLIALAMPMALVAQVLTSMELPDPTSQHLQQRYIKALMAIGAEIETHKFPYPFYFTRLLDVDEAQMKRVDQRSIRFDIYQGQTVLEITGNYYAAYTEELMDTRARVKETFNQVILPILQAETAHFPDDSEFYGFAIEVSHHVRQKVLGIITERPENVMLLVPVGVAQKLVDAKTDDQRQAAILDAKLFLDGQPYSLWLHEGAPPEDWKDRPAPPGKPPAAAPAPASSAGATASVSPDLLNPPAAPMHIFTPEALANLQRQHDDTLSRMVKDLDAQAHFLPYAPPAFVGFRQGAYLELSVETHVNAPQGTSRYKLAALAFDEQVSHLIRPVLTYFPQNSDFDGISFSSIIRLSDGSSSLAVEFYFPFRTMRCFASYDCTGQQLLDSGTIVINGERAALDLEIAEGKN
ncbi:MAG TPA: hypothetical protein VKV05_10895 [Terriglobales bacterium]|nr:hypothetical protein [Terriglobales bacterium]